VVAVREEGDFTALEVECLGVWEVVADEVLRKASLVVSLSNDKMPMRRLPLSPRGPAKLVYITTRRAIRQMMTVLLETSYRIPAFN
jgi:hypothetical protein